MKVTLCSPALGLASCALSMEIKTGGLKSPLFFSIEFPTICRFEKTYFSRFPGYYMSGDGAKRDADGYLWITGRIDDMLNCSGHLMSTAQVLISQIMT